MTNTQQQPTIENGQCYECFTDTAFQYYGQSRPELLNEKVKGYVDRLEEGLRISCYTCGSDVEYNRNEKGQWVPTYTEWEVEVDEDEQGRTH